MQKQLVFSPTQGEINVLDLSTSCAALCQADESVEMKKLKVGFIKELEKLQFVHSVAFQNNYNTVSLTYSDFYTKNIFKNQGKVFELLLYNKLKDTGLFSDVQTGVSIAWDNDSKDMPDLILEKVEKSGEYGFDNYVKALNAAKSECFSSGKETATNNEIDVVLTNGMQPIFISCKAIKALSKKEIYEISSIAKHFHAKAVLAVTKDFERNPDYLLLNRARDMDVSLIGFETIFNQEKFNKAMQQIARGKTTFGVNFK